MQRKHACVLSGVQNPAMCGGGIRTERDSEWTISEFQKFSLSKRGWCKTFLVKMNLFTGEKKIIFISIACGGNSEMIYSLYKLRTNFVSLYLD